MKNKNRVCPASHSWSLNNFIRKIIHNPKFLFGKYIKKGDKVIDLGCGPGLFSVAMAKIVGKKGKVIALDIQKEMLNKLKKKIEGTLWEKTIKLHKSKPDNLMVKEKINFALAFYVIHEVPSQEKFMRQVYNILKLGSKFLIVEPNHHVSKKDFAKTIKIALSLGFKKISYPKILFSRAVLLEKK